MNYHWMKRISLIITCFFAMGIVLSQELPEAYRIYRQKYPESSPLNCWDSLYLRNIPVKPFNEELRSSPLPPVVDNSELPFLRPVFMQEGPSCGQAAMVGYNFTYETDYLRNIPATFAQSQYPTHFTWNFQNGGEGWYGVSYFHSIEILRRCGCMNVFDYGGTFYDDGKRWIDGYDSYYNAMFNRVRGFYSIPTGTADGILALKYWLCNHMGEGAYGGVASYYANVPWNANILNDTTPEGGKHVMTAWYPIASHAMTIVGYNDSIRWDYNWDGQYTNHIDLNGDGEIDPRDWEIGAVKFVNSHGLDAQDSGFCYMMYKCLAETFEEGGVWNQSVHILDLAENYIPRMTYKVTLKHDMRQKVKILAGVSRDTSDAMPSFLMDFPIIDYQGANHYLQGNDTAESLQYLEFGLDVTPLLSHLEPGEPAKFFFMVEENDPEQEGSGEITSFSLMDYTLGTLEVPSDETPVILANNARTTASVIHVPEFEIIEIISESLPPFTVQEPYLCLLQAENGEEPYEWDHVHRYRMEQSTDTLPMIEGTQVLFNATYDTIMPVALGFSFSFFGVGHDTAYMHVNGHLQFTNAQIPWPYMLEPALLFRTNRLMSPMTDVDFTITPVDGDGGWAETTDTSATFRWKLSSVYHPGSTDINFAIRIFESGNIEFYYGSCILEGNKWLGGISAGNNMDYVDCPDSGAEQVQEGKKISFIYPLQPSGMELTENGLLSSTMESDNLIYDLTFRVTDQSGLSDTKTLQFTSGPYLYFTVQGDQMVNYGDTVGIDLEIRNGGEETLVNPALVLSSSDPFVILSDASCLPGTMQPGQVITIPGAFQAIVSAEIPDQHDLLFQCHLDAGAQEWEKEVVFKANAPIINLKPPVIDDGEDARLDPGESAPMLVAFQNMGHAALDGVSALLVSLTPEVQVTGNPSQYFGTIAKGASVERPYMLYADESAPEGLTARFVLFTSSQQGLQFTDTISITIGRIPILVIDMDPNQHSGPFIYQQLIDLGVFTDYEYNITDQIFEYQALFISLGYHFSNHVLTLGEGLKLSQYLEAGGRIYMEGKKVWKDDPGTPVQPMFNIGYGGTVTVYDTLVGIDTTFTADTRLGNGTMYNMSFYNMVPIAPAFTILQDNNLLLSCAVAYDAGNYKTIGSIFDFGTLIDLNPSVKADLMMAYLEFFDIYVEPVGLEEDPGTEAWRQGDLVIWPNPASEGLSVEVLGLSSGMDCSLVLYDILGRIAPAPSLTPSPKSGEGRGGGQTWQVDVSTLPPGIYVLKMISDEGSVATAKFLKVEY
jgi:hypothetical protein